MRKVLLGAGVLAAVAMAVLLVQFQPGNAATNAGQACEIVDSPQPTPLSACAKIECGTCPGPKCKIDGICCYVPGTNGAPGRDGVASCGCDAQGEPVCKCDVGQPR